MLQAACSDFLQKESEFPDRLGKSSEMFLLLPVYLYITTCSCLSLRKEMKLLAFCDLHHFTNAKWYSGDVFYGDAPDIRLF